jgi:hypothetical protein
MVAQDLEGAKEGRGGCRRMEMMERNRSGFGMSVGLLLLLEVFYIFRGLGDALICYS